MRASTVIIMRKNKSNSSGALCGIYAYLFVSLSLRNKKHKYASQSLMRESKALLISYTTVVLLVFRTHLKSYE